MRHPHRPSGLDGPDAFVERGRKSTYANLEQIARAHLDVLPQRVDGGSERLALDHTLLPGLQVAYRKTKLGHVSTLLVRC